MKIAIIFNGSLYEKYPNHNIKLLICGVTSWKYTKFRVTREQNEDTILCMYFKTLLF